MRKEEKFLTDIKNDLRSTGEKEENLIKYFLDRFRGNSYIRLPKMPYCHLKFLVKEN